MEEAEVTRDDFTVGDLDSDLDSEVEEEGFKGSEDGDDVKFRNRETTVMKYKLPMVNAKAKSYQKIVNINLASTEPPVTKYLFTDDLHKLRGEPLVLKHLYHNQCVECHIKVVSDGLV